MCIRGDPPEVALVACRRLDGMQASSWVCWSGLDLRHRIRATRTRAASSMLPRTWPGRRSSRLALWRPSTGAWSVRGAGATTFGRADAPEVARSCRHRCRRPPLDSLGLHRGSRSGDYDGDGKAQLAVWRTVDLEPGAPANRSLRTITISFAFPSRDAFRRRAGQPVGGPKVPDDSGVHRLPNLALPRRTLLSYVAKSKAWSVGDKHRSSYEEDFPVSTYQRTGLC